MTKIRNIPQRLYKLFAVVLAVTLVCLITLNSKAENVIVEQETNPDLEFMTINSGAFPTWKVNSSFSQNGEGSYSLNSNTWGIWTEADHGDYAYKQYGFDYGSQANFTEEVTIDSWKAQHANGSIGIMIRSSLKPGASAIFFHVRQEYIMIIYRMADGMTCTRGQEIKMSPHYPISLRLELNRDSVTCYYRYGESGGWAKVGAAPFTHGGTIYAGVGAHSSLEEDTAQGVFSNLKITIDAPEGSVPGGGEDPDKPPIVDEDNLPEDPPLTDEQKELVLMRETFTDGSLFDGEESATNPIWKSNTSTPNIVTDEEKTNRYLYSKLEEANYIAGDQSWTDYSMTVDLRFTSDSLPNESNEFMVLVRHTDIAQYGYHDYAVRFHDRNKVSLGRREYGRKIDTTDPSFYKDYLTVDLPYAEEAYWDTDHTLRVDAMDNVITVYWDGEQIMQFTDLGDEVNNDGQLLGSNVKANGCIGFINKGAAVAVDNILVLKLYDPIGGDYDNAIGGNWDQPIPDYIQKYIDNGWCYQ